MSLPQNPINTNFAVPWWFRRPYLHRYLEKQWVNEFFETGRLRLSSFKNFAKLDNQSLVDPSEGSGILGNETGEHTVFAVMSQGSDAYVLCGSAIYRKPPQWGKDSGFRINDTTGFASIVTRFIPGCRGGIEGLCHYVKKRSVVRNVPMNLDDYKLPDGNISMDLLTDNMKAAGDDLFFLKEDSHADELEYRLLWFATGDAKDEIFIEIPEARQFCIRIEDITEV